VSSPREDPLFLFFLFLIEFQWIFQS
jgi:hypothetical protein